MQIKIPKELKERMMRYNVNWDLLIREFIVKKLDELEREEHARRAVEILRSVNVSTDGFALREVRRYRDSD
jgi:translation initiation factor 2 gamma subunit (eIF-2gamma)